MRTSAYQRGSVRRQGASWVLRRRIDGHEQRLLLGPAGTGRGAIRTAAAARSIADARLAALHEGAGRHGERITLERFAPFFLDKVCAQKKASTRAGYASAFRVHLLPALGKKYLTAIGERDATELVHALERAGRAPGTVRLVLLVLAHALAKAAANGFAARQLDLKGLALYRKRVIVAPPRTFSLAEIRRILDAAALPWRALYALMALAGLRGGEALGLTWDSVDLAAGCLTLGQQAYMGALQSTKTASSAATIWISPALIAELAALRDFASGAGEVAGTALLFPSPRDARRPYWASGVRRHHFGPLLARLGIAPAGLHAFRHSFATELFRLGHPAPVVRQMMRHADLKSTLRYARTTLDDQKKAAAQFAAAIGSLDSHPSLGSTPK